MGKLPGRNRGQTLISIIIALALFSILAHTLFTLVGATYKWVSYNRSKISARHLGQDKIEFIRNLPFNSIGTSGGVPSGTIPQEETVRINGNNFHIKTTIIYIDDPFDNLAPQDLLPTDYKRIRVEISWEGIAASNVSPVTMLTDVSPRNIETTAGGGTLSIVVFDANGEPVPQADVTILQTVTSPGVNLTLKTNDNGRIMLPGAPACNSCYQISTTKPGYSIERTYSTSEVDNPLKPHPTIIAGELSEVSFNIDLTSDLVINTTNNRDSGFAPLANVAFNIRGDKIIGTDSAANPIYKYDESLTTDGNGHISLPNLEWGNYYIQFTSSAYDVSGINPSSPINISPNTDPTLLAAFTAHTDNNVLFTFNDNNNLRIASVSARLHGGSFDEDLYSGATNSADFGQSFFGGLEPADYTLEASASGYVNHSGTITINGGVNETIILLPQ